MPDWQHAVRDDERVDPLRLGLARHADGIVAIEADVLKRSALFPEHEVVRGRQLEILDVDPRRRQPDRRESLRMWVRKRLQQDAFEYAEHCRVSPDSRR